MQEEISTMIRTIRRRMGLTQEKLAAKLGVTFPTVNRWEHGRTRPSPLALMRIKELVDNLSGNGLAWPVDNEGRLLGYRQEIIIIDSWPVLEQGTD